MANETQTPEYEDRERKELERIATTLGEYRACLVAAGIPEEEANSLVYYYHNERIKERFRI